MTQTKLFFYLLIKSLSIMGSNTNETPPEPTKQDFPIVGIGASAGGLDAFKQFLSVITPDSGMAYVLVQHLDPTHDSKLAEILARCTTIPVHEITDEIHLAPDTIYVIPENKILTSTDGILKLSPRGNHKKNHAIDIFFKTLAEIHLKLAVGVVLSGTGNDGTEGLKEIKAHGGITFAQNQDSSTYDEMPQNAINAQVADYILPPEEMPAKLIQIMSEKKGNTENIPTTDAMIFQEIIAILTAQSGVDFSHYKESTVQRRIARQMTLHEEENLSDYLIFLRKDKTAATTLFHDLLIPVTNFFRDPKVFNQISATVFPVLLQKNLESKSIRIWSAGCATGEEPYSLAISLLEFLGENKKNIQIKIFASDVSELSLAKARKGFYTTAQTSKISEVILKKYFIKKTGGYQISAQIRDLCIFALHNFLKDPPFAKMDFLSCRNVLIYMDAFLQKKALATFHYALSEDGFLVLGKSETAINSTTLFNPFEKAGKIYKRRQAPSQFAYDVNLNKKKTTTLLKQKTSNHDVPKADFLKSAEKVLFSTYIPASVIINEQFDVVYFNGDITPFLGLSNGKATFNLLKIAKGGLAFELRSTINKAKQTQLLTVKDGISILFNDAMADVCIKVQPLTDTVEPHYLILFYKTLTEIAEITTDFSDDDKNKNSQKRIRTLEKELIQTHSDVTTITEELENSNQELQTINEELLSGTEELQSLNEELETSKEELQSTNEELNIINKELLKKQDEINISKEYTEAIVATLREPIVVLDTSLHIKNINNAFSTKYKISNKEAQGKLIYEILGHLFGNNAMKQLIERVLFEKAPLENYQISVNLYPEGESIMLMNARQITNEKSQEKLILLAIEDITDRKRIESRLQDLSDGFEKKVKERTCELENSVDALHKANLRLQQFAYIASHDLQEPLRKISIFASLLQREKDKLSEKNAVTVDKIIKSSIRMQTLISDLLTYSYLNNEDNVFVATDLNEILKVILIDFELLIEEKQVDIKIGLLPTVKAIPLQMNQLFYNLLSNALKFLEFGKQASIEIKSILLSPKQVKQYPQLDSNLLWCEIIFIDNGIGFDEKFEKQIFTIFKRLHGSDDYSGNGIGLSISSKIVENHHGLIFAKSAINKGAAFHVVLPIGMG
jgi:two-component system CheB/CheR fusion protein